MTERFYCETEGCTGTVALGEACEACGAKVGCERCENPATLADGCRGVFCGPCYKDELQMEIEALQALIEEVENAEE